MSARSCCALASRRWRRSRAPARRRRGTRSTPTCCVTSRSPVQPGVGAGHDLHSDGAGPCLPHCGRGCGQSQGIGALGGDHPGSRSRQGGDRTGLRPVRCAEDRQYRPRQFTAKDFTRVVLVTDCQLSMDGRGAWCDNVFVERLWRSVKYERVYLKAYDSVYVARTDRHRRLSGLVQHAEKSFQSRPAHAHRKVPRGAASIGAGRVTCNPRCAMSCLPRRSFVASDAGRRGQLCTVATRPDSTYKSGNAVQTTGATSLASRENPAGR